MDQQKGRSVLVEFWDFCRINSLRTLPYMCEWYSRYQELGLRVIGVHSSGFPPSSEVDSVEAAVQRLGIEYPVVIDHELAIWDYYGNRGWPARYLWNSEGVLEYYHYGEGAYTETELEIQTLLSVERDPVRPLRPEDESDVLLPPITADQKGAYSGPYEAGGVWGVFEGRGTVYVNSSEIEITHPGCYQLIEHNRHSEGTVEIATPEAVVCHATCFVPGRSGG